MAAADGGGVSWGLGLRDDGFTSTASAAVRSLDNVRRARVSYNQTDTRVHQQERTRRQEQAAREQRESRAERDRDRERQIASRRREQRRAQEAAQERQRSRERERSAAREAGALEALARREEVAAERRVRAEQQAANRVLATRRTAARAAARQTSRREERAGAFALGGVGVVAALGTAALTSFGAYQDEVRQRLPEREALGLGARRLAVGDIGDASAQSSLDASVRRESLATGLRPQDVLGGLERAQSAFSVLGNERSRESYLTTAFPAITRTAVVANAAVSDVVDTAGELQRQMQFTTEGVPDALARLVTLGRSGSVTFRDMAAHMGVLGGMTGRFMRNTTDAERSATLGLTGGLFQIAGEGGASGDQAATRLRGFLTNFTSQRGQRRLRGLFGTNILDQQGQLRAAQGQSQQDAFAGLTEQIYRRTRGNSQQFNLALAGTDSEGQVVADRIFRDILANGGRAANLRRMMTAGEGEGAASITRGFENMVADPAVQRAQRENAQLYRETEGTNSRAARATENQMAALRVSNPTLSGMVDNRVGRAVVDAYNMERERLNFSTAPGYDRASGSTFSIDKRLRGTMARGQGLDEVVNVTRTEMSDFSSYMSRAIGSGQSERDAAVSYVQNDSFLGEMMRQFGVTTGPQGREVNLSDSSEQRMARAVETGVRQALDGRAPQGGGAGAASSATLGGGQ